MSWRPIAGRWIRQDKEPKAEDLIDHSVLVKNTRVRILSPEDNLLQVAIHTAKHSYVREPGFRLHLDVERIVKHHHINWELFLKKVDETGTKTAVYYSLFIAKNLFETPVPLNVLQKLNPGWLKNKLITGILKKVKLLHPTQKKFTKIDFVVFQLLLYDSFGDITKVIFPSVDWMKKKYQFKSSIFYPYYLTFRIMDLVGVRKKK